ncbi:MAG: NfeD family protein [Bdellovibrionota bacterium]|nr:MAG: NfeD family protein [Pseudomonadota bacterium]
MSTLFNTLLILGVVIMVAEIFVPGFVLLPIGAGIFTAAFWTYVFDSTSVIIGLATVHSAAFFLISHRYFRKTETEKIRTNTDHMIGQRVMVTEAIHPQQGGYVKLYGDLWKAMSSTGESIDVGEEVIIQSLSGNKVIVARLLPR